MFSQASFRFALAWCAVYFTRVVLITNGMVYVLGGCGYLQSSYDALDLRAAGNSSLYRFPQLSPVIKDSVIQAQFDGLIILAPFSKRAQPRVGPRIAWHLTPLPLLSQWAPPTPASPSHR